MANWKTPRPKDTWNDQEHGNFGREIFDRFRFFSVDIPVGFSAPAGGVTGIFFTPPGGGGDVETELVRGLRRGMPMKLTYSYQGSTPPTAGLTWDCSVQADDTLNTWFNNSSGAPVAIQDGPWAVMGIVI